MPRKLKVYRTSVGFSDAYVAAPSQKAALAAWGADANLFARGMAEEVIDPNLMQAPLAKPGKVLKVSRGDLEAHLKALQGSQPAARIIPAAAVKMEPAPRKAPRKRPPPRRDRLDAAELALAEAKGQFDREVAELERKRDVAEKALTRYRENGGKKLVALASKRSTARTDYQDAMEQWSK